jgi:hypothetical protein
MKRKRTQKQKRKQPVEEVEKIKRFFKKIVFGEYFAYGMDDNHDVYKFDAYTIDLFKSKVKNIFDFEGDIFLIDLDGKLFRINESFYPSCYRLETKLRFKKLFVFDNRIFGNTMDGNIYYLHLDGGYGANVLSEKKLPYHFKKIIYKKRIYDSDYGDQLIYDSFLIAIDYDNRFYMCQYYPSIYSGEMHYLGRDPKGKMIVLCDEEPSKWDNEPSKWEIYDKAIWELLYEKKEFTIDCSGKKIDVKMIHNYRDLKVVVDGDGRIYFMGDNQNIFSKVKHDFRNWIETSYFIEITHTLKAKTRKQQQDKLFNLLKNEKKCDLSLNFFFSSSSSE